MPEVSTDGGDHANARPGDAVEAASRRGAAVSGGVGAEVVGAVLGED
jgi:hypothetical protein